MAQMTAASIDDLPDSDFAHIEPGGHKDAQGKTVPRSLRHFPIHDAAHVRNALSRAPQSPFGEQAMPKIKAAAKKFGIDYGDSTRSQATLDAVETQPSRYTRTFELSDISIRTGGDGRTVDAYAAVFDSPAAVRDQDGEYEEVIDRNAFDAALAAHRGPLPVLFNHGRTLYGTPSERYSVPIGVSEEIRPDGKGLFTRSRYHKSEAADEVLEAIRGGSITAYSFQGQFTRSNPLVPRGGFRKRGGELPLVRRTQSTLLEYGPGTFAVYKDAAIMGVRAEELVSLINGLEQSERTRLAELLTGSGAVPEEGPPDLGGAAVDLSTLSGRSIKEQMTAGRARFLVRHGGER